jgi:preprotein translocase subunit SecG
MYTLITLFYVSCIGIVGMLFLKHFEIKRGRTHALSRIYSWADGFFSATFATVQKSLSYLNRHTLVALTHWIAFHILVHIRRIYVDIKSWTLANPHGKKILDAVRGRGEIRNHGASFYLRRISDK